MLFDNGRGVLQDRLRAMDLFAFACQNGFETACQNYRIMNSNNSGRIKLFGRQNNDSYKFTLDLL
ncbi:hypothetical protein [Helicobacter enhydrae]|uniref:hypothetical protein n=1 Tax=Helicobacter enhydrae TaxID=222136 RepID=UPI0018FF5B8A